MKKTNFVLGLVAFSLLQRACTSYGSLTISLQFADGGTTHLLTAADVGTSIPIDVYATVSTPTPVSANNHDGIQYVNYDLVSSLPQGVGASVDGQLTSPSLQPIFGANGSQVGVLQDLNGDGVTDLGGIFATSTLTQVAKPRSGASVWEDSVFDSAGITISPDRLSVSFLLEKVYFQVNSLSGLETVFSPQPPTNDVPPYTLTNWFEDDPVEPPLGQGVGAAYTHGSPIGAGTSVTFFTPSAVPEPATSLLLVIGGAGFLSRRRRQVI